MNETWPELWLRDPSLLSDAQQILKDALSADTTSAAANWHCTACGEEVEGQFTECWNCGGSYQ